MPGCALIALAYAGGTLLGDRVFDAPGAPLVAGRLVLAALQSALLLLARRRARGARLGLRSERGRALSWVLGITIGMYAANFLLVAVGADARLRPARRSSGTSRPARRSSGSVPWGDALVLAGWGIAASGAAIAHFRRRDLV